MKLIILEGIPTAGKTVLGEKITNLLKQNLNLEEYEVFYFNDDVRNEFNIDILEILKNQNRQDLNLKNVKNHMTEIVKLLFLIEKQKNKKCIFVIDRFYFSYLSHLNCDVSEFKDIEKSIRDFTYYLFLGFKNYNENLIYDRLSKSLELRGKKHGFVNYFNKLITDELKGDSPRQRIYNHYLLRYEVYNKSFKNTLLNNKIFIKIDNIIKKDDYDKVLENIFPNLFKFVQK